MKTKLLCIGAEPVLLQSRCEVLAQAGYEAECFDVSNVSERLNTELPPVVVLCSALSAVTKRHLLKLLPPSTKIVDLPPVSLTGPNELLKQVRAVL